MHSSVASSKGGSIFSSRLDVKQDLAGTSKKVSGINGMKARDRRAVEYSLSIDLAGPGGKSKQELKKQARLSLRRKKEMLRRKSMKEKRLKEKRLKMAKVALKLMYKDVLPVVGALAISSGEILREKVIPAMKDASVRAGRVATDTIQALQEYAPLVRDTLQSSMREGMDTVQSSMRESMDTVKSSMRESMDTVMVGMKKASVGVSAAAKEFQSKYSSALTRLRAKQAKKVERHRLRTAGQVLHYGGVRNIVPR